MMRSIRADEPLAVAVCAAIREGNVDTLERHLREAPELATAGIADRSGVIRTLLHVVADWPGHVSNGARSVAILVAAGADVNAPVVHPGPHGAPETALHWAASSDDVAVLDALLDGGADIEAAGAIFTGGTPMSDAVVFGQWRAARRLLDRGATTTIWQAAALGLLDRVQDCCAVEPAPAPGEITNAFWNACRGGQASTAEYLLGQGADLNWIGHDGKTPCDAAQSCGNESLIQWLRSRGAKRAEELK